MTAEMLSVPPVLARVLILPRDPSFYFAFALAVLGTQLLVWGLARHSADIEWWRATAVSVIGILCGNLAMHFYASGSGLAQVAGVLLGGAFVTWIVSGWLYEVETWQRAVLAFATPVIGTVAMIGGILIKIAIFGAAEIS